MASVRLPVLKLDLPQQQYTCHGCGNCCRDFTVQLRQADLDKLAEQKWEERLDEPVTVEFRGRRYLRQRESGACVFLMDNGLCRIHAEYGFEAKPIACQFFPFHLTPSDRGVKMGLNFACQSVQENKGAALGSHIEELGRMGGELEEMSATGRPPMLVDGVAAEREEVSALTKRLEGWLGRSDLPLMTRLDGLAWIVTSLNEARLAEVRGKRFVELLNVLFGALPGELDLHPIAPPSRGQVRMLRRAVFTRTEDPKIYRIVQVGKWRTIVGQLLRGRRFARGRGVVPPIGVGWPDDVALPAVERVGAAGAESHAAAIDDLITRYLRATVLGERAWAGGYYGWPMLAGLQAMTLNVAVIGWLARLHAAGRGLEKVDIDAVRAALGRVDRTSGRAPWLGSRGERWRLKYLQNDDGFRRLVERYQLIADDDDVSDADAQSSS